MNDDISPELLQQWQNKVKLKSAVLFNLHCLMFKLPLKNKYARFVMEIGTVQLPWLSVSFLKEVASGTVPQTASPSKSLLHRSLTWIYWYSYPPINPAVRQTYCIPHMKYTQLQLRKKSHPLSKRPCKNFYHYFSPKTMKNYFCFSEAW